MSPSRSLQGVTQPIAPVESEARDPLTMVTEPITPLTPAELEAALSAAAPARRKHGETNDAKEGNPLVRVPALGGTRASETTPPIGPTSAEWSKGSAVITVGDTTPDSAIFAESAPSTGLSPGLAVIPYLPPLLDGDRPYYHHHLQIRPIHGQTEAEVTFDRYAWAGAEYGSGWRLLPLEPLNIKTEGSSPFLVVGPLGLNPECPQLWTLRTGSPASVLIGAIPRRPELPTLQLLPGVTPPPLGTPHTMSMPARVDLPNVRDVLPCRLEVFPLTPTAAIAVRFRLYDRSDPRGETPFLFRSALTAPRAWEIHHGRRIFEENPETGELEEMVEATPEAGQIAPVITVFSGRLVATFSWRSSPTAPCFSVAGLIPEVEKHAYRISVHGKYESGKYER